MNNTDPCKFVVALGFAAALVTLAIKADDSGVKKVLTHTADACNSAECRRKSFQVYLA